MRLLLLLVLKSTLVILPFTAALTLGIFLAACSPRLTHRPHHLAPISELGVNAFGLFVTGFTLTSIQMTVIIVAWWSLVRQHLHQISQTSILNHLSLILGLIAVVFCLLMAYTVNTSVKAHMTGAFGVFGLLVIYEFLQFIQLIRLRSKHSLYQDSYTIFAILWIALCVLCGAISAGVWIGTFNSIPEYLAAGFPFVFSFAFAKYFWMDARRTAKERRERAELPTISSLAHLTK
ncbi:unnamed protein product [Didymodactylos carnosus]|uniref:CWH43-like N-terminal domain-containing protein n=1 Tax=Didymodactylos carnosus TaxID=1234261 RepID=A0A814JPY9_9BILA|nr:unnamed protein product [Didymodactylos carnosus]CAF1044802.1 unnamed protein product [Didymodactylos carnosus]CAF3811257.1 unnamed protein product [Didymodactylos carnosus]CAF3812929.1 unnamed protein product [Didymodactylos carnosus]